MSDLGMRIGVGALLFEGNSFSAGRTDKRDFANKYLCVGEEVLALSGSGVEMAGALALLRTVNSEAVPLLATHGGSGGRVTAETYAFLKEGMIGRLKEEPPLDGLYLALHGAMLVEGLEDPEGDILEAVRKVVGRETPLVISCDMHANVTQSMVEFSDAIIGYQHYPHDDTFETGMRSAGLLVRMVRDGLRPEMAVRKVAAIFPPVSQGTKEPGFMRDIFCRARGWEESGELIAASYFSAQPWLDVPDVGFTAVCIGSGQPGRAQELADEMVRTVWEHRNRFVVETLSIDAALREGDGVEGGPVILVELADCVGAGATGDSAQVLSGFLSGGIDANLFLQVVDPATVARAISVGVDGIFQAQIGNRLGTGYGPPVEATARVVRIVDGSFVYSGGLMSGIQASMGTSVVLEVGGATVLTTSTSAYEYADEQFRVAGIDVQNYKFVVVKNPMNFKQAFAYAPRCILLDTRGPATPELNSLPWKRLGRPCFPMDDRVKPVFRELEKELREKT